MEPTVICELCTNPAPHYYAGRWYCYDHWAIENAD